MKKFGFITTTFWAILAISSCEKATEIIEDTKTGNVVTIRAGFSDDTKTSYENEITFSWNEGDKIGVWTTDGNGSYEKVIFEAKSSGPSVEFQGTVSEGYTLVPDGKAFYPDGNAESRNNFVSTFNGSSYTVTLGGTIDIDLDNPMSIIPLVGNNDGTGKYVFKTATGIIKVTYNHLQAKTIDVCLKYASNATPLNGIYNLVADEVKLSNCTTPYGLKYVEFSGMPEDGSGVFYFPVPTGKLPTGLAFETRAGRYSDALTSITTTQEITITRNKITNINVTLDGGSDWRSLGTGKFLDNYFFSKAQKSGVWVDVEVLKHKTDTTKFLVGGMYKSAWTQFEYPYEGNPSAYMAMDIVQNGDTWKWSDKTANISNNNLVIFHGIGSSIDAISTGLTGTATRMYHPLWKYGTDASKYTYSKVISRQTDANKTPAIIQLAYDFDNGGTSSMDTSYDQRNGVAYIVFPDCDLRDAIAGTYSINNDSNYSITISKYAENQMNITNYHGKQDSDIFDINGNCYGSYSVSNGTISFTANQHFAQYGGNASDYYSFKTSNDWSLNFKFNERGELYFEGYPSFTFVYITGGLYYTYRGQSFGSFPSNNPPQPYFKKQ